LDFFYEIIKWAEIASTGIFLIIFLGKTFYLRRKSGLNAIILRHGNGINGNIFVIASVILVNIWIAFILLCLLNETFRKWLNPLHVAIMDVIWIKIIGLILLITSFIFFISAQIALGNSWRLGIDRQHPGRLVTEGIYSISRHPIYLFFDLYFLSIFLLNSNIVFLIFTVIISIILHLLILSEEKYMIEFYGAVYKKYKIEVKRYLSPVRIFNSDSIGQDNIVE
jgi:protein-S-isoprenylcysteine O-methyltransferase Ste14